MANSKTFTLTNDLTVEDIGEHLVAWFQNTKNMIAEGGAAQGGYFVQAKDADDGWKKFSGLTKAIQVQLIKAESNVVVNCDFGKWSDKIGAGAVGMFLFAPLAATAAFGAVKQSQLPDEIFAEKYIVSGGKSVVVSLGGKLKDDEVECPVCHAKNPKGQKFCKSCGNKLQITCPNCGADMEPGAKFCPKCGGAAATERTCANCGAVLSFGQKFCPSCGSPVSDTKVCPNCKTELEPDAAFCPECGTKVTE